MPDKFAPAVILSHGGGGLGTVRALARRQVPVTAIAYDRDDPVLKSRHPTRKFAVQADSPEQMDSRLLEILEDLPNEGAALLATSDRLVTLMSDHRSALKQKYRFVLPSVELLDALNDKSKEVSMLQSFGFHVPKTVTKLPEVASELQTELRFPIIFKPYSFAAQNVFPLKNAVVHNQHELAEFFSRWQPALPHLLAQEVITGSDRLSWVCSCTFDHEHVLLDCGIKQKIRCLPAHFGGSTFAVSKNNSEILKLAELMGTKLEYVGHAGIEFRWDERDGLYRFIELNPRIPANVGFDEGCGLSTVWNSYLVALGTSPDDEPAIQKEGIYFVDLTGDIASLAADKTPVLGILKSVLSLLFRKTSGFYFTWDDPLPGILVGYRFARRALRKAIGKITRRG